uniref:Uncharacterized protein n=1 Tax=Nicotiana tabacum TaxID=4097 RepID=A0A1S3XCG8_TOBAC|nr:PREDICTED: uncharacterized protein LOC107763622 [Nicotiana tabacum]
MGFIDVPHYQLCFVMTRESVSGATFDEVVDIGQQLEMVRIQERENREAKRPLGLSCLSGVPSGQSYHNKGRPYRPAQMAHPVHHGAPSSLGSYSVHSSQSSLNALLAQSLSNAPSVLRSSVSVPSSSYSSTPGLIQPPPPQSKSCFEYGDLRHMW